MESASVPHIPEDFCHSDHRNRDLSIEGIELNHRKKFASVLFYRH